MWWGVVVWCGGGVVVWWGSEGRRFTDVIISCRRVFLVKVQEGFGNDRSAHQARAARRGVPREPHQGAPEQGAGEEEDGGRGYRVRTSPFTPFTPNLPRYKIPSLLKNSLFCYNIPSLL